MKISRKHTNLLRWPFAIAAYAWLAWKLYNYDDYDALFESFQQADVANWLCLLACACLMPINIELEAQRWKVLLKPLLPVSTIEARKQVLGGLLGAFLTPYRAGELPTRVYMLHNKNIWKEALVAGLFGGGIMTLVIVLLGIIPAAYSLSISHLASLWSRVAIAITSLILLVFVATWYWRKRQLAQHFLPILPHLLSLTILRYLCFSLQMALMLFFVGVHIQLPDLLIALPVYYLLVTLTPNMPVADAGIRGSWAIFVFSRYSDKVPMIALAAVLLWVVNTVIPVFAGMLLYRNQGGVCLPNDEYIALQDVQNP